MGMEANGEKQTWRIPDFLKNSGGAGKPGGRIPEVSLSVPAGWAGWGAGSLPQDVQILHQPHPTAVCIPGMLFVPTFHFENTAIDEKQKKYFMN